MKKLLVAASVSMLIGCFEKQPKENQPPIDNRVVSSLIAEMVITEPEEQQFIADIRKLRILKVVNCDGRRIEYLDVVNGKEVGLKITAKPFLKVEHEIEYHVFQGKTTKDCLKVDGVRPRGGYYGCPTTELDTVAFTIDGNTVDLGNHFKNYYNPIFCKVYQENFNPNPLLTYSDEGYYFIYLMGGKGVDRFLTKFVCDEKTVLHSYYLDGEKLRAINGFNKNFIGF